MSTGRPWATALGVLNFFDANYNYDLDGNPLPLGQPVSRTFGAEQFELYVQDIWRVKPGLTVTAGLRWTMMPPVREVNGLQVSITPGLDEYIARRLDLAENGQPTRDAGAIGFVRADDPRGGPLWTTHYKNFSPRLAVAFSPDFNDGSAGQAVRGPGPDIDPGRGGYLLQQLRDGHDADARPQRVRPHQQGDQPDLHGRGVATLRRAFEPPRGRHSASSSRRTRHAESDRTGMEPGGRLQRAATLHDQSHLLSGPRV